MSHQDDSSQTPRPYNTWRVCGRPVDDSKPSLGCTCGGRRRAAPVIETDQENPDHAGNTSEPIGVRR